MNNLFKNFRTETILNIVWEIVDVLVTFIKGVLIVGGSLSASLADVVLGSFTLSLLFVNTGENIQELSFAPFLVSLGASGIQLILWQMIQNGGGFSKVWKSKNIWLIGTFVLVLLMKFGDDFMDIAIVIYLMQGSTLPITLGHGLFSVLYGAVLFIVWVLVGFSEVFIVSAIELMKGNAHHNKPGQSAQPPYKPHPNTRPETSSRQRIVSPEFIDLMNMSRNRNAKR